MASLIQMSPLIDLEKDPAKRGGDEAKAKRLAIVALLERPCDLATRRTTRATSPTCSSGSSTTTRRPTSRTRRRSWPSTWPGRARARAGRRPTPGPAGSTPTPASPGRSAPPTPTAAGPRRKTDRDRAIRLAKYLVEKFPNDAATDRARFALARLKYEDGKPEEAYDAALKVRPGFEGIAGARLFEGAVASQLLTAKDLPLSPERKLAIFHRTTGDLARLVKPLPARGGGGRPRVPHRPLQTVAPVPAPAARRP